MFDFARPRFLAFDPARAIPPYRSRRSALGRTSPFQDEGGKVCNRRIFLFAAPSSEGLPTEPTAATQPRRQEPLFVPLTGPFEAAGLTPQKMGEAVPSIGRGGRVEDGRGSWGPMAITPFPISAHRTGGPDFRSPALRLASLQTHGEAHQGRRSRRSTPSAP